MPLSNMDVTVGDTVQFLTASVEARDRVYTVTYRDVAEVSVAYENHLYTLTDEEVKVATMIKLDPWSEVT